jgi:antirestriction protein ArdC
VGACGRQLKFLSGATSGLSLLNENDRAIVAAASKTSKAAGYLRSF